MSAAPLMPTLEQAMAAQFLRRDIDPPGEVRVPVRVRTCATGLVLLGYTFDVSGENLEPDARVPMRFATVELQMFPSHVRALHAEMRKRRATDDELKGAVRDLWNDLVALEAVDGKDEDGNDREPVLAEIVAAFDAGTIRGRTERFYRPSFPASFRNTTRRDFFPIVGIEVEEGVIPEDAGVEQPTRSKRAKAAA